MSPQRKNKVAFLCSKQRPVGLNSHGAAFRGMPPKTPAYDS